MTLCTRPLFEKFPALVGRVPFTPLADLPTPLEPLPRLSAEVGGDIWIKRDGRTHPTFGGNKIRRFEFMFGDIVRRGSRVVITGGGLGSNHTLATAVIARQFGLRTVCAYYDQPIDETVRHRLRCTPPLDIEAHWGKNYAGLALILLGQYIRWWIKSGKPPYFIYPGAPETLGVLGYANALLEIAMQWDGSPAAMFVAVGSCGTLAGLLLGARLIGWSGLIIGVRIIETDVANRPKIARMVNRAARYLRQRDPSVPPVHIQPGEVELWDGYTGAGYAHPTPAARRAVDLAQRSEGLSLETTYTGKTLAAVLDYAGTHPRKRVLWIDTLAEQPQLVQGDWHDLPRPFWRAFSDETQ